MDRQSASPDVIEKEMEETRAALTDKVAALEHQVVGTLQTATDTVQTTVQTVQNTVESVKCAVEDTMSNVKHTVNDSVHAVADQVKSTFDFSGHVRERPWAMVGGAAVAGFVVGMALPATRRAIFGSESLGFRQTPGVPTPPAPSFAARQPEPPPAPAAPATPSWIDEVLGMATREMKKLGEEAVTLAAQSLRQSVQEQVPTLVETGVSSAAERLTGHPSPGGVGHRPSNGVRV